MKVTIKGMSSLNRKLGILPKLTNEAIYNATNEVTETVKGYAESNLQSSVKHASGELSGSVKSETEIEDQKKVVGRVWTDKKQGIFREFGTGPVGQKSTKDLPSGITPVYTQKPWFFPVASVSLDLTELYGMFKLTINNVEFYKTSGQPARPWLYPALKKAPDIAPGIYKEHVQKKLKELK